MAHTKTAVRKLVTKAEMTLLDASFPPALKDITLGRLKQKIARARKLADKYRDLAKQQRGEARGKRKAKGTRPSKGNANTVIKQEIFTEARERFQGQLEKLEAKAAKELARQEKAAAKLAAQAERAAAKAAKDATRTAKRAAKTTVKKAKTVKKAADKTVNRAVKKTVKKAKTAKKAMSSATRGVRKAAALARTGSTKHKGHVGARGRRNQARRDSR